MDGFSPTDDVTGKKAVLGRGRPRREDAEEIDRRLASATLSMVLRHGSAVTMNAIVEASGVSRKTVYARHANKSALLIAVIRHLLDFDHEPLVIGDSDPWQEALRQFVAASLKEICQPEAMALRQLLMVDPAYIDKVRDKIEQIVVRRYMDPLASFLRRLIDAGKIPAQDTARAAEALSNLILAEAQKYDFLRVQDIKPSDLDDQADYLVGLFCHGIFGPTTSPSCQIGAVP